MKDNIELKLNNHLDFLLGKDVLSAEDINFLIYMLNRAEMKEAQEANKAEMAKNNEEWKNRMKLLLEGAYSNG